MANWFDGWAASEQIGGAAAGVAAPPMGFMDWFKGLTSRDSMIGSGDPKGPQGWVSPVIDTFSGLANSWTGMQQLGLAEDAFKEQKKMNRLNYTAQANMTNSQLADRQAARIAASPGSNFASVEDYMKQYGVKGIG